MSTYRILLGDCRESLRTLPDASVQCCVTSPPYWGLRDYGTASWEGGDPACDHRAPSRFDYALNSGLGPTGVQDQASNAGSGSVRQYRRRCGKCGAVRIDQQLGLEQTPEEYVARMVEVFREVRRVLRDDGTLWLNLGDSYANDGKWGGSSGGKHATALHGNTGIGRQKVTTGLKPKDLVGIPWRVAFALQADGWYLRSDIIWAKPNPMPESVTDRPTKAHEYVFLLSKSERYYYDADAIAEPATTAEEAIYDPGTNGLGGTGTTTRRFRGSGNKERKYGESVGRDGSYLGRGVPWEGALTRNARTVWTIATKPFKGAHFATFPPELAERCILAGTSQKGACADCGAPWVRQTERLDTGYDGSRYGERAVAASGGARSGGTARSTLGSSNGKLTGKTETTGWAPSCECNADVAPCVVLDPFGGSGTTGMVATGHGRRAILCELKPAYADLIRERCGVLLEAIA